MNGVCQYLSGLSFTIFVVAICVAAGCGKTTQKDPAISGFSPASGLVGTQVIITGDHFDTTPVNNLVRFNKVQATVLSASETELVAEVPVGATTGTISVTTSNGTGGSGNLFFVTKLLGGSVQGFSPVLKGSVSTVAGSAGSPASNDGVGGAARFNVPFGITTDGFNLFISDRNNNTIRQMDIATGNVTTIAGSSNDLPGSADGTGSTARFNSPGGITTDGTNLYVCDTSNHTIRKIVIASGFVTTVAGTAPLSGSLDGTGSAARFNSPGGITTDGTNLYVCDTLNHTIRKIVIASGFVTTVAGTAPLSGFFDAPGISARFNLPTGIATDGTSLFITDRGNNALRSMLLSTSQVSTIANSSGLAGITDGNALTSGFNAPTGITSDGVNLFVADFGNKTIREYIPASSTLTTAQVTTLAGFAGQAGSTDAAGALARFSNPSGITVANTGLFIADSANHTIRLIQ
jgi:hypothetical protein